MGAIQHVVTTFFGYECDKPTCRVQWLLDEPREGDGYWHPDVRANARAAGWSFWRSRSNYVFCPDHGPSRSSKRMVEVTR